MRPAVRPCRHRHVDDHDDDCLPHRTSATCRLGSIANGTSSAAAPPWSPGRGRGTSRRRRSTSLDELLRLAGFKVAPSPEADEVLRRLVIVAADDPLAARIVLQRFAARPAGHRPPGTATRSRRRRLRPARRRGLAGDRHLSGRPPPHRRRRQTAQRRPPPGVHHAAPATGPHARGRRRPGQARPATAPAARLVVRGADHRAREARRDGLADDDLAIVCDYLSVADGGRAGRRSATSPRGPCATAAIVRSSGSVSSPPDDPRRRPNAVSARTSAGASRGTRRCPLGRRRSSPPPPSSGRRTRRRRPGLQVDLSVEGSLAQRLRAAPTHASPGASGRRRRRRARRRARRG